MTSEPIAAFLASIPTPALKQKYADTIRDLVSMGVNEEDILKIISGSGPSNVGSGLTLLEGSGVNHSPPKEQSASSFNNGNLALQSVSPNAAQITTTTARDPVTPAEAAEVVPAQTLQHDVSGPNAAMILLHRDHASTGDHGRSTTDAAITDTTAGVLHAIPAPQVKQDLIPTPNIHPERLARQSRHFHQEINAFGPNQSAHGQSQRNEHNALRPHSGLVNSSHPVHVHHPTVHPERQIMQVDESHGRRQINEQANVGERPLHSESIRSTTDHAVHPPSQQQSNQRNPQPFIHPGRLIPELTKGQSQPSHRSVVGGGSSLLREKLERLKKSMVANAHEEVSDQTNSVSSVLDSPNRPKPDERGTTSEQIPTSASLPAPSIAHTNNVGPSGNPDTQTITKASAQLSNSTSTSVISKDIHPSRDTRDTPAYFLEPRPPPKHAVSGANAIPVGGSSTLHKTAGPSIGKAKNKSASRVLETAKKAAEKGKGKRDTGPGKKGKGKKAKTMVDSYRPSYGERPLSRDRMEAPGSRSHHRSPDRSNSSSGLSSRSDKTSSGVISPTSVVSPARRERNPNHDFVPSVSVPPTHVPTSASSSTSQPMQVDAPAPPQQPAETNGTTNTPKSITNTAPNSRRLTILKSRLETLMRRQRRLNKMIKDVNMEIEIVKRQNKKKEESETWKNLVKTRRSGNS